MPLNADQLNDLRKRILANEPYTQEECAAAVRQLIAERLSSFDAKPKASKSKATPISLDDLI